MTTWADQIAAAVFRATGEATEVTISELGTPTSYPDCKILTASQLAQLQRGGVLADVENVAHAISVPRGDGLPEPSRKSTVTAPGSVKGSVLRVAGEAGYWVVAVGV